MSFKSTLGDGLFILENVTGNYETRRNRLYTPDTENPITNMFDCAVRAVRYDATFNSIIGIAPGEGGHHKICLALILI